MGLKKYYIDGISIPDEQIRTIEDFIQINAFTYSAVPEKKCCFIAFWEETIDPTRFPCLKDCLIQQLP